MSASEGRGEINNAYSIDQTTDNELGENDESKTELNHYTEYNIKSNSESELSQRNQSKMKHLVSGVLKFLIHIIVGVYFGYATYHYIDHESNHCALYPEEDSCGIRFCNGYGLLVLITVFVYLGLFYYFVFKPKIGHRVHRKCMEPLDRYWMQFGRTSSASTLMIAMLIILLGVFLYFETRSDLSKLTGLTAPILFILTGYIFSTNRRAIKWRIVITGITCQFLLGVICIRWEVGRNIFACLGEKVATFLSFTDEGSRFVFGNKIIDDNVFAFTALPVIFFLSFFISILYYLGTMQWMVLKIGWVLQGIMGTTVCESVISAANIFLGMSESPLLIRPYFKLLTASEFHAVMVSGFATVSGTVMAAYLSFGASAAHLITSSVMAAPATLAFAKLYLPETDESKTSSDNIKLEKSEDSSVLEAASSGASNSIPIVLGIVANIVSFVAFIAFLNAMVSWLGELVGVDDIDFEWILSKLFMPLAWTLGVPWKDCEIVGKVVATKSIINEFVAYERLGRYARDIDARSNGIATFAICGFANPSSLGILIGALGALAPNRRKVIASVAPRAFIVGSIVCFISASFAGILMQEETEKLLYKDIYTSLERRNGTI